MSFITSSGGPYLGMYPRFMDSPAEEDLVPLIVSYINQSSSLIESNKVSSENFLSAEDPLSRVTINQREWMVTVSAMIDLHLKSNLTLESLFCAVHMLGRLIRNPNPRVPINNCSQLMMTGFVCLWSAAKVEETMWEPVCGKPHLQQLVDLGSGKYNRKDICALECEILQALGWKISPPNIYTYLLMALHAGYANEGDRKVRVMTRYLAELSLFDPRLLINVHPSRVAASCLYLSMRINKVKSNRKQAQQQSMYPASNGCTDAGVWTSAMSLFTCNVQERSLLPVVNVVRAIACGVLNNPNHPAKPVQQRYAGRHFEYVSMQAPPSSDFSPLRPLQSTANSTTHLSPADNSPHERLSPGEAVSPVIPPHTTRTIRATPLSNGTPNYPLDPRLTSFQQQLHTSSSSRVSQKSSGSSIMDADNIRASVHHHMQHMMNLGEGLSSGGSSSSSLGSSSINNTDMQSANIEEAVAMYTADFLKRNGLSQSSDTVSTKAHTSIGLHPDIARKLPPEVARRVLNIEDESGMTPHSDSFSRSRDDEISILSDWMAKLSANDEDQADELEEADALFNKITQGGDSTSYDPYSRFDDEPSSTSSSSSSYPTTSLMMRQPSLGNTTSTSSNQTVLKRYPISATSQTSSATTGVTSSNLSGNKQSDVFTRRSTTFGGVSNSSTMSSNKPASASSSLKASSVGQGSSVTRNGGRSSNMDTTTVTTVRTSSVGSRQSIPMRPSVAGSSSLANGHYHHHHTRGGPHSQANMYSGVNSTRLSRAGTLPSSEAAAAMGGGQLPPLDYQSAMAKASSAKQPGVASGSRLVPSAMSGSGVLSKSVKNSASLSGNSSAGDYIMMNKRSSAFY